MVASWAHYAEGVDEEGQPIEIVDRLADQLKAIAGTQGTDPTAFIANRELFGDLIDEPGFVEPYVATLNSPHSRCPGHPRGFSHLTPRLLAN